MRLVAAALLWFALALDAAAGQSVSVGGSLASIDAKLQAIVSEDGNLLLPKPAVGSDTAGIAEYLAELEDGHSLTLGAGVYQVTKPCTNTTTSDGADANNVAGGGVFIVNGWKNRTIRGRGMGATRVEWHTPFTVSACGLAGQSGAPFSLWRVGSGGSSASNVTENIRWEDISFSVVQTDLDSALNVQAPPTVFHITDRGIKRGLEWDHVDGVQKQDEIAGGTPQNGYVWFIDRPLTGSTVTIANNADFKIIDSRCRASGTCLFNNGAQFLEYSGNDFQSVIETGYACSDHLTYKTDGNQQGSNNRFAFMGDCATHCGMAAPGEYALRWQHWDGRGARDFAGKSATEAHALYRTTPTCAKRMFEGEYITGYNGLTLLAPKFECTVDDIDSDTAGDAVRDVCETVVIQIDKRDNGADTDCPVGQSCNIGLQILNPMFFGFRDTCTTGCVAFTDSCPIQVQEPDPTQLGDNWFSLIWGGLFFMPEPDGDPDTGVHADGFCGTTLDYLTFNFIGGNVAVGNQNWCIAGQGINTCPLQYDIVNRWVTMMPPRYAIAALPPASTSQADDGDGRVVIVIDSSDGSCANSGGTTRVWCEDTGAAWTRIQ